MEHSGLFQLSTIITVPTSSIPLIIGPGGGTMRQIQRDTDTQINILTSPTATSPEAELELTGYIQSDWVK